MSLIPNKDPIFMSLFCAINVFIILNIFTYFSVNMNSIPLFISVLFVVRVYPLIVHHNVDTPPVIAENSDSYDSSQETDDDFDNDFDSNSMPDFESQLSIDMENPLNEEDFKRADQLPEEDEEEMERSFDMLTDRKSNLFEGDIKTDEDKNAIKDLNKRWPRGRVPYVLSNEFNGQARAVIAQAFRTYRQKTCIRFVRKRDHHKDFIHIIPKPGCWSYVGRNGGRQELSLQLNGCIYKGTIEHELMHALGFWHEQSRADRDNYIQIQWQNIEDKNKHNFDKYNLQQIQHLRVSYDYKSIMHYSTNAFSKNNQPTIIPKKPGAKIGNRNELSRKDLLKINRLYKCKRRRG